jgi:hypothetical protein
MTITRFAVAGAIAATIPMLFAATTLSAGAVVISALVLGAIGAALGAVTAWAIESGAGAAVAVAATAPQHDAERLAA